MTTSSSYKAILKATGVFGVMQFFKLFVNIISSKVVAVLLGPAGIGIISLLTSAVNLITAITSFEFITVATKEVASQENPKDVLKMNTLLQTLHKISMFIGLLGFSLSLCLSKYLSLLTFSDTDHSSWFRWLSIYFVCLALSNARLALLQGMNSIKKLASCQALITILTSLSSISIYYFLRFEGIVWVFISAGFIQLFSTFYFTRNYSLQLDFSNLELFFKESSHIISFGLLLSINLIIGQIIVFFIKWYLNDGGNATSILGYYDVTNVVLVSYLGLIFNAMAYDFYPRLAAISNNEKAANDLINQQIEIALLIVTPAILIMSVVAPFVLQILYSKDFLDAYVILKIALFSVIVKAVIFPLGYYLLVKSNKKIFFFQALLGDVANLFFSVVFYNLMGIKGLGLAILLNYILHLIVLYVVIRKKFNFHFQIVSKKLMTFCFLIGTVMLFLLHFNQNIYVKIVLILLCVLSIMYSIKELHHRIDFNSYFSNKK